MKRSQLRRLKALAIFVTFMALGVSLVMMYQDRKQSSDISIKDSEHIYRNSNWINKNKIVFNSNNFKANKSELENSLKQLDGIEIYLKSQPDNGIYIYRIKKSDVALIKELLAKQGSIVSEDAESDTALVNIDLAGEEQKLSAYEKEYADLSQVRFPSQTQIQRKEELHHLTSETRLKLENYQNKDKVLLYLIVSQARKQSSLIGNAKTFILTFLPLLGLFFIGAVIVYYGTKMMMLLLGYMGVKPNDLTGQNYGGGYNYSGNYRYSNRYYNSSPQRRKKRIYKEKPSSKPAGDDDNNS